jgi:hypothetical protein
MDLKSFDLIFEFCQNLAERSFAADEGTRTNR